MKFKSELRFFTVLKYGIIKIFKVKIREEYRDKRVTEIDYQLKYGIFKDPLDTKLKIFKKRLNL